jgi:hypothetical protein
MGERAMRGNARGAGSSEAALLLAAACPNPGPAEVDRACVAMSQRASIDWERFIPLARSHGVLPLLYRHLSTDTFDARLVPDPALTLLRHEAEKTARRSLMLAGELVSLVRAFEDNEIRVVPLKGPVLAQQLYGSVALRRINDLDLLVAERDVERATALIVQQGHEPPQSWGSDALDAMYRERNHDVQLRSTTKPYCVELHYYVHHPLGSQHYTFATVEDTLERVPFFGVSISVMRAESLLVYLCVHGTQHVWERIEWVGGVAELLRGGRISDWDRVGALARRFSAERALRSGLDLAQTLFDVPMPAAELFGDRLARVAAQSVATRLARHPARIPGATERLVHQLRTDMGVRKRATRLWSTLFVPTLPEMTGVPLPRVLTPLHYVLRPARLLLRRLRRLEPSG